MNNTFFNPNLNSNVPNVPINNIQNIPNQTNIPM